MAPISSQGLQEWNDTAHDKKRASVVLGSTGGLGCREEGPEKTPGRRQSAGIDHSGNVIPQKPRTAHNNDASLPTEYTHRGQWHWHEEAVETRVVSEKPNPLRRVFLFDTTRCFESFRRHMFPAEKKPAPMELNISIKVQSVRRHEL